MPLQQRAMPFFFVGTGIKFDIAALTNDVTTMAMVPIFLILFFVVRTPRTPL